MIKTIDGVHVEWGDPEETGTYTMLSKCINCGRKVYIRRLKGYATHQDNPPCPNCGCNSWFEGSAA